MNAYIFILSPPHCGSTLLSKLIATSSNVSCLPEEGQFIPEVTDRMRKDVWVPEKAMPWTEIKAAWHQYWDADKPYLLEKSPPNIIRSKAIQDHFQPAYFIVNVRDPYAYCEGLMRRRVGWDEQKAAEFCLFCLKEQIKNLNTLENAISITYEQLCDRPDEAISKIREMLPQIGSISIDQKFALHSIDGQVKREITNLNTKKIQRFSAKSIQRINQHFADDLDVLKFWGYELYQPDLLHEPRRFWLGAIDLWTKRIYPKLTPKSPPWKKGKKHD